MHVTAASLPAFGVSRMRLDAGSRVGLFTDQANPTSDAIYQRLGYRPVADMVNLRIDPAP